MKKILFVALGATLLAAGCQKTEIINPVSPNGQPEMSFTTNLNKLTKSATATGTENLQDQGFVLSVFAAYDDEPNEVVFGDNYDDLDNVLWSYDNDWVISTGNSYFWPGKERDLVFFAVSAQTETKTDGDNTVITPKYDVPEVQLAKPTENTPVTVAGFTISDYTVVAPKYSKTEGETYGTQTGADDDLMVADVVIQNQDETPVGGEKGRVDLFFNHTLSKVEFVFNTKSETAAAYPVVLNSIVIKDVVTKADLNVTVDLSNRISENKYVWGTHKDDDKTYVTAAEADDKAEYSVDYNLDLNATEQTYSTWLVIPQDLTNKQVAITYTITDASNQNVGNKPTTFTSVWPLAVEGVVDAWEINNYVKYKVTLAPNLITFNPVLEKDWNNEIHVDPSTGTEIIYSLKTTDENVTLYYKSVLAVGTAVYTDAKMATPAADASYTLADNRVLTVAGGKVTAITEPTPETPETPENTEA